MIYTPDQTTQILDLYQNQSATISELVEFMLAEYKVVVTSRSIIAKLSAEKVYKKPVRKTKTGADIIKKEDLVASISSMLQLDFSIASMVKMQKEELRRLVARIEHETKTQEKQD